MTNSFGAWSKWWLPCLSNQLQRPGVSGQHDREASAPRGKLRHPSQAHGYEEQETGPDRLVEGPLRGEMEGWDQGL